MIARAKAAVWLSLIAAGLPIPAAGDPCEDPEAVFQGLTLSAALDLGFSLQEHPLRGGFAPGLHLEMLFGTGSVWSLGLSAGLATHRAHAEDTDLQISGGLVVARSLYRIRMTEYLKDGVWKCHSLTDDGWGPVIMLELGPQFVHRDRWRAGAYTSLFLGLHTVQDEMPWGATIGLFLRPELLMDPGPGWALVLGLRIDGLMALLSPLVPLVL